MPILRRSYWLPTLLVIAMALGGAGCAVMDESPDPEMDELLPGEADEEAGEAGEAEQPGTAGDPAAVEPAEGPSAGSDGPAATGEVWDALAVDGNTLDPEPIFSCGSRYCRNGGVWCQRCCNGSGFCWTTCGGCSGNTRCSGGQCRPN